MKDVKDYNEMAHNMPIIDVPDSIHDSEMSQRLSVRFSLQSGLNYEISQTDSIHLIQSVDGFLDWFNLIEELSHQPLGRRLAHAAADHETLRLMNRTVAPPRGIFSKKKRLNWLLEDWQERGIGSLKDISEGNLQVSEQVQSAMAGGQAAGAWEFLTSKRYRFRWEQVDASKTNIILDHDPRMAQPPRKVMPIWKEKNTQDTGGFVDVDTHPNGWQFRGNRSFLLGRDLILRFEDEILPHIERVFDDGLVIFKGLDDPSREGVWNIFARAQMQSYLIGDDHVLIDEVERWKEIIGFRLTPTGMGGLIEVNEFDQHGGVKLTFEQVYHPAFVLGMLMGFWQRAYGRDCRGEWVNEGDNHVFIICGRHILA
jgi:hypothetical protein